MQTNDAKWFVIATRRNVEPQMAEVIASKGFEVFLPKEQRERRHARRTEIIIAPMISGYLFTRFAMRDQWEDIAQVDGFVTFLGRKDREHGFIPSPVEDGQIERLIALSYIPGSMPRQPKPEKLPTLAPRTRAIIYDGILEGFEGLVVKDSRGNVLLSLDKRFGGKSISVPRESVRELHADM